jgi:hypothetical protein
VGYSSRMTPQHKNEQETSREPQGDGISQIPQLSLFELDDLSKLAESIEATYTVVDAILEVSAGQRLPRTFTKSNIAIHVQSIEGNYSLVMRMLMNVLLALSAKIVKGLPKGTLDDAFEKQQVLRFEASATDIKTMLGWSQSNDYQSIYDALDDLMRLIVRWSINLGEDRWTESTTMLSSWGRTDTGKVSWSWMPSLCKMLFDFTDRFTMLDLVLLRKFKSKYSLAIYENCVRYKNCPWTTTMEPSKWVSLIAGPSKYKDYREFKRTALKPAIEEINSMPGCPITVQLDEIRGKRYNRVEKLRFRIFRHKQNPLFADLPAGFPAGLLRELQGLRIAPLKLVELTNAHSEMYLAERLRYVNAEIAKNGNIQNPAGFFINAVESRAQLEFSQAEAHTLQAVEDLQKSHLPGPPSTREITLDKFDALALTNPEKHAQLLAEFLNVADSLTKRAYERRGPTTKSFRVSLGSWLETVGFAKQDKSETPRPQA